MSSRTHDPAADPGDYLLMTMIRTRAIRLGILPLAALAAFAAGCGTQTANGAGANVPSVPATAPSPSKPLDFPCPGESTTPAQPTTPDTTGPAVPPTDHYAENHGFMVPFPLHGKSRCDGLAAVDRVKTALEPLSRRGDLDPASTRTALTALGYTDVESQVMGNGEVTFLIDASPLCLEGTMNSHGSQVDAFGGYPDHTGCDRPSGGH